MLDSTAMKSGAVLYLVGTPIGNLEDITIRALRVLKEVNLIACEDTRHTQKLLSHFQISSRTTSYHEHNEFEKTPALIERLQQGNSIALVTDAGMPGISDPGFRLITQAIENQIQVIPIPGPSAFLTALAASGMPANSFQFHGFLPAKKGQRQQALETIKSSTVTEIFYEAPHRLKESLEDMVEVLGMGRRVVVARELTKVHEEFLRGTVSEVLSELDSRGDIKGEITVLIGQSEPGLRPSIRGTVGARFQQIIAEGFDEKAALKKIAKERGVSKSEAYRALQRSKSRK